MMRGRLVVVTMVLAALMVSCGDDATAFRLPRSTAAGTLTRPRTIQVTMVDNAFEPTSLTVLAGETIRFVFTNDGTVQHEAVFGDLATQEAHAATMRASEGDSMDMTDSMDGMDMTGDGHGDSADHQQEDSADNHDDDSADQHGQDAHGADSHGAGMLSVQPGASSEAIMTFDEASVDGIIIGCHVAGHWEAGMRVDVVVALG